MTVHQIAEKMGFSVFCMNDDVEVTGVYCCDLLSNALVKLKKQHAWLTVMNNVNVAAVAYNNHVACVVLTEGVTPDEQLLERAKEHNVVLLGTHCSTYEAAVKLEKIV